MTLWADTVQAAGWEAYYLAIPSNTKNSQKSIEFIDYLFSQEGCRLLFSGVEDEHWKVVDGTPIWTNEVLEAKKKGGSEWEKLGIYFAPALYMLGLGNAEIYEKDGAPLDLSKSDFYYTQCLTPVDKEYCKHFGVSYPMELFINMKKEGRANTHEDLDMRIVSSMGSAPDDITLKISAIVKAAAEAIPSLVMAKSDEEFINQKQL